MPYNSTSCTETLCTASDQARAVYERRARHAKLDLRAICDGVEEADEVCFMSCEAWVGGCGADLRNTNRSAGEGCEEKAGSEVPVTGKLNESLVGVGRHGGRYV